MNNNPIICDPDSEEAKALIGQECEFSNVYIYIKTGVGVCKGKLENILCENSWPFGTQSGVRYAFIRKAEEKISDRLEGLLNYFMKSEKSEIMIKAIEKLRELGE
ncbi:MAG: hypothetical protein ACM34M_15395 [Ignavibacteria bacterium]